MMDVAEGRAVCLYTPGTLSKTQSLRQGKRLGWQELRRGPIIVLHLDTIKSLMLVTVIIYNLYIVIS